MIKLAPDQWQRLKDILAHALEKDTAIARADFVRRSCGDDTELLHEAESLLHEAEAILRSGDEERLELCANEATRTLCDEDARLGLRLGPYQITSQLGRGGMGTVYLAERVDGQFEKRVAVKILKRGTDTDEVLRRFRSERQILADLDHPNITRLLDAGTTEDGLPYFIMDCVSGQPITSFAREHHLDTSARLALFLKVCAAVQFAHQRHIIHRDIKPGNVLVNDDAEPKLLDFGIAKLISDEPEITQTVPSERRLTPSYAAPEQVAGMRVTVATDVYSLGALLKELLTNESNRLRQTTKLPPRLNAIIDRALASDPQDRFASVSDLADAIKAYLSGGKVPSASRRRTSNERLIAVAAACAIIAAAALIGRSMWLTKPQPTKTADEVAATPAEQGPIRSLAVLPFQPIGQDADKDLLGLGMADAVIGRLTNVSDVIVLPTGAVSRLKDSQLDPSAAAKALGVDATLSGTVQRANGRVRISVQLTEAASRHILLAETYEQPFTDIFHLQDELAENVARSLSNSLSTQAEARLHKHNTGNTEAYEFYLAGLAHYNERTRDQLALAIGNFEKAIAADPRYAMAYALMADCYFLQFYYGFQPSSAVLPKARAAADRALLLDSSLAEGYLARSMLRKENEMDADLQRALQLNPNSAIAHQRLAWHLCSLGNLDAALAEMNRARELDPLSPTNTSALGTLYFFARNYNEALHYAERAVEMSPQNPILHSNLGLACLFTGDYDRAIAEFRQAMAIDPQTAGDAQSSIVTALVRAGRIEEATRESEKLTPLISAGKVDAITLAALYGAEGKMDLAFDNFAKALKDGTKPPFSVSYDPILDPLRSDPRFDDLLAQAKKRAEQASSNK